MTQSSAMRPNPINARKGIKTNILGYSPNHRTFRPNPINARKGIKTQGKSGRERNT